jgi:hypothetical protein
LEQRREKSKQIGYQKLEKPVCGNTAPSAPVRTGNGRRRIKEERKPYVGAALGKRCH